MGHAEEHASIAQRFNAFHEKLVRLGYRQRKKGVVDRDGRLVPERRLPKL